MENPEVAYDGLSIDLERDEFGRLIVDLKFRIEGEFDDDFDLVEESEDKIVLGTRAGHVVVDLRARDRDETPEGQELVRS